MIGAFLDYATKQKSTVIAVEERFEFQLSEDVPSLVGYIDLVETRVDADGIERLYLIDWKTAGRKPSSADDLDSEQLILYAIAAHRTGILKEFDMPLVLEYRVLTKTKNPEVIAFQISPERKDGERLIAKAEAIWKSMEVGVA